MKLLFTAISVALFFTSCSRNKEAQSHEISIQKDTFNETTLIQQKLQEVYDLNTLVQNQKLSEEIRMKAKSSLDKLLNNNALPSLNDSMKVNQIIVQSVDTINKKTTRHHVQFTEGSQLKTAHILIKKESIQLNNEFFENIKVSIESIQ